MATDIHDLAVFRTVDYLVPNARAMHTWLDRQAHPQWAHDMASRSELEVLLPKICAHDLAPFAYRSGNDYLQIGRAGAGPL